jgi:hypothetical protein
VSLSEKKIGNVITGCLGPPRREASLPVFTTRRCPAFGARSTTTITDVECSAMSTFVIGCPALKSFDGKGACEWAWIKTLIFSNLNITECCIAVRSRMYGIPVVLEVR